MARTHLLSLRDEVIYAAAMTKARSLRLAVRKGDAAKAAKYAREIARLADVVFRYDKVIAERTAKSRAKD